MGKRRYDRKVREEGAARGRDHLQPFCETTMSGENLYPSNTVTAEIARVGGHYTLQGHSGSLILVPIENLYATLY